LDYIIWRQVPVELLQFNSILFGKLILSAADPKRDNWFSMRIRYITDPSEATDDEVKAYLTGLRASGDKAHVGPLYTTLVHSPGMFKGFRKFFGAIRFQSTLPLDIMELAMCRVGVLNKAAFLWMLHLPMLEEGGLSAEGIETVRTILPGYVGTDGERGLSIKYWTVLRFVDCMTQDVKVPDAIFDATRKLFSDRQILELGESGGSLPM
jgi:alkylhydroperoxidase family enzyme